jgi:hypothetical protein
MFKKCLATFLWQSSVTSDNMAEVRSWSRRKLFWPGYTGWYPGWPDWEKFCPLGECLHTYIEWKCWPSFIGWYPGWPDWARVYIHRNGNTGLDFLVDTQGDKIGHIFDHWASVYIGYICRNWSAGLVLLVDTQNDQIGRVFTYIRRMEVLA